MTDICVKSGADAIMQPFLLQSPWCNKPRRSTGRSSNASFYEEAKPTSFSL